MLLAEIVAASRAVAATRSRKAKAAALAECLRSAAAQDADLAVVVTWLAGGLRQRRTGLGWRSVSGLPEPAPTPTLRVAEVDAVFEHLAGLAGPGSATARAAAAAELFGRATADEQRWLAGAITGEVRQGAMDALVQEGVAAAAGVPLPALRRAAMLAGSTAAVVEVAFADGEAGLAGFGLEVGRPVLPMLASSAPDLGAAIAKAAGAGSRGGAVGPVAVDAKLDGIRLQVHKDGDDVVLATRSLDVITARLPEVTEVVRRLPARRAVLDAEALWLDDGGRPRPFQETASRAAQATGAAVTPYFFDLLHLDGTDLLDAPAHARWEALAALVPESLRVRRIVTDDAGDADEFFRSVLAAGHEGVVVKAVDAPYDAGRRGAAWVKVKPVHTLDLVVLAVEWGSGRRRGLLSNIHLGARDEAGGFVMLGKTFKGMSDEMLAWQTQRFTELAAGPLDGHVVQLRPEQVVEIALDGVQRSTRYPGGVALRFARVVRYRDDKHAADADTLAAVRALTPGS